MDGETQKRLVDLEERIRVLEVILLSGIEEEEIDPIERHHRKFAVRVRAQRERQEIG